MIQPSNNIFKEIGKNAMNFYKKFLNIKLLTVQAYIFNNLLIAKRILTVNGMDIENDLYICIYMYHAYFPVLDTSTDVGGVGILS